MGAVRGDQCQFGPRTLDGELAQRPTRFVSNCRQFLVRCAKLCRGGHAHSQLVGGARTAAAQSFPPKLVTVLAEGVEQAAREALLCSRAVEAQAFPAAVADDSADPDPVDPVDRDEEEQETRPTGGSREPLPPQRRSPGNCRPRSCKST